MCPILTHLNLLQLSFPHHLDFGPHLFHPLQHLDFAVVVGIHFQTQMRTFATVVEALVRNQKLVIQLTRSFGALPFLNSPSNSPTLKVM